jgi:hypothetical protein
MKKFKNHQRPRRKYRFNIVGHKKALKIWWDSPFNQLASKPISAGLRIPCTDTHQSLFSVIILHFVAFGDFRNVKL